ncbi:GMC family oxidoreductase [Lentzea sp. BCCO 10_0856]|uniref:GMC family oxidoreductase n=1 Tax=Lentzea miocenica TaxID=3095431 RepID=A0ABU4SVY4_9PSEU|nr:GMC family oxidoreductase [Lentzea sp. BCCO 10_0856]MDX8030052.1 GMC family oxidoreductase [Lentzea sp. BCCO 10_0856]
MRAVVVGAGFAGSLIAKVLGDNGFQVLVLEAGAQTDHDEALRRFQTALVKTPLAPYRSTVAAPSSEYVINTGPYAYSSPYLRMNGGTGTAWTGITPRMHPEDFHAADLGHGRNWPISYDDLEPYYRAAEWEIGISADADEQRQHLPVADGYRYPMHALPRTYLDHAIASVVDGASIDGHELLVVGTPQARNGKPTAGYRPDGNLCAGYASCVPICPEQAKYTPHRTQKRWPPNVELRTRCVVNRVHADEFGRITKVSYQRYEDDTTGRHTRHEEEADVVILAAHAIENAKLLLMSGLANSSDQVGRNLMDHPALLTWALMPHQIGPFRGPGSTTGIEAFRTGPQRCTRAPFRVEIGNWGWGWSAGSPDSDTAEFVAAGLRGKALRQAVADRVGRQFALQFEIEQEADPANRVTLAADRDALGNPRPSIHYGLSDYVKDGLLAAKRASDQIFELLGADDHTSYKPDDDQYFEHNGEPLRYWGAGHGGGTHVMGASRRDSVVDQWQRCWDHPNLYAVGCGSMPSLGTSNPSITMAALVLRTADHLVSRRVQLSQAAHLAHHRGAGEG